MRHIAITMGIYVTIGMAFLSVASYFVSVNFYGVEILYESPEELGDVVVVKFGQLASVYVIE